MPPNTPRYISPQEQAETRARLRRALFWSLGAIPVVFLVMMYGYSDQAPAALRDATITLDGLLGRPVWSIISPAGK